MLAVTIHLTDYVRCLSFERWWHCHQKKQSDKFKEDSRGHNFTATLPTQRPKKKKGQCTLSKKELHSVYHFAAERGKNHSQQVLYSTNYISFSCFFLWLCFCHPDYYAWSLFFVDFQTCSLAPEINTICWKAGLSSVA